ncbi:MAG: trypsin-like peptidase domain-containing protein, partial [Leptolyngbyaceae cyanobacterium]
MPQSLFELLRDCTVKLVCLSGTWGTGFWVAPGQLLTCAHVVDATEPAAIEVYWRGAIVGVVESVEVRSHPIDLALVSVGGIAEDSRRSISCVALDEAFEAFDDVYTYGHPTEFPEGAGAIARCDDVAITQGVAQIKFQGGQIQPGHSGSPLLNRRTQSVCGVVVETLEANSRLGGLAVPVREVLRQFPELRQDNQAFHRQDDRWRQATERGQKIATQRLHVPYPRNAFFTGREAVFDDLHRRLQGGRAAINQTQGISGLGGIGKTQTAVEYAYRYFEVDYDWVFWLRADTLVNLRSDLAAVAGQVGLVSDLTMELDDQIQVALGWLNGHDQWLLVVDNADDSDVLEQLTEYLPTNPAGRILITSRQSVLDMVNVQEPLALDTWERQESVDFLLRRTNRTTPQQP